jgi:nicotinamide phosphoribosyltransferase
MFKPNPLGYSDGYKPGHKRMLAPGTEFLYGTWIPRSTKHAPPSIDKVISIGQQMSIMWLHDIFEEYFFKVPENLAMKFGKDLSLYIGQDYDYSHFKALHRLGYLPIEIQSLPEGIETPVNIPHMTFINTVAGYAWLPLYLETPISAASWKMPTNATTALQYKRVANKWIKKTDQNNIGMLDYLLHDFASRGLDPYTMLSSGLGHASSFRGSDSLICIEGARYYYGESEDEVCINSVNASEHSVTCTGIFFYEDKLKEGELNHKIKEYYSSDTPCEGSISEPDYKAIAEWLNLADWLKEFPTGILSVVSDTFDLWKLITFILPRLKDEIMARDGKLVIRPDSGDPVDIVCGVGKPGHLDDGKGFRNSIHSWDGITKPSWKGVVELLGDIFGYTINDQGFKVLDSHIGAIYGDSINLDRQIQMYERLASKGWACTNIVLGIGSFTYQFNTRDTFGYAAKGAWFQIKEDFEDMRGRYYSELKDYNIYKDPITDDGTKKSLKGIQFVQRDKEGNISTIGESTKEVAYSNANLLHTIYKDGKFFNPVTLTQIRERINKIL